MIIYDSGTRVDFFEFGIKIPVKDSRASLTFERLKTHPVLGACIDRWFVPKDHRPVGRKDLERVHDPAYVDRLFSDRLEEEIIKTYELVNAEGRYYRYDPRQAQLPLRRLFDRILERVSGSWQCCEVALEKGFCFYFGGGMHHAQKDRGNGFCMLNDIVIALRRLQADGRIRTAWVIDVDAHKGDGTAAITAGDPSIVTLSIHMGSGWPLDGPSHGEDGRLNPSFVPSDIDIPVFPGEDRMYLDKLRAGLGGLDRFGPPDLAVVVSGADPYEKDELPSTSDLRLTLDEMFDRDRSVYAFLKERRIPMAYLMAGGYGDHSWEVYSRFLEWALSDRKVC